MEKYPVTEEVILTPYADGVAFYFVNNDGIEEVKRLSVAEAYGVWGWLMRWIEEREEINRQRKG